MFEMSNILPMNHLFAAGNNYIELYTLLLFIKVYNSYVLEIYLFMNYYVKLP